MLTVMTTSRIAPRDHWVAYVAIFFAVIYATFMAWFAVAQLGNAGLAALQLTGGFLVTAFFYPRRGYPQLKGRLWPAAGYAAIAWTAGYGVLKLYWSLGGDFLLAQAPLTGELRRMALAHDPLFDFWGLWVTVGLALVGIAVVVAVMSKRFRRVPRWILVTGSAIATTLLLFRGVTGVIGDGLHLAGLAERPADPLLLDLLKWDFALWAPYFLVWGVLWVAVLWRGIGPRVLSSADGVAHA
jgi:hypothetical protein